MCSSEDCEKLWFLYKLEGEPKGVSIEQFCIQQGVPYQVFNKWFRNRKKRIVPVEIVGRDEDLKPADKPDEKKVSAPPIYGQLKEREAQNEALHSKLDAQMERFDRLQASLDVISRQLTESNKMKEVLQKGFDNMHVQLDQMKDELVKTQKELRKSQREAKKYRELYEVLRDEKFVTKSQKSKQNRIKGRDDDKDDWDGTTAPESATPTESNTDTDSTPAETESPLLETNDERQPEAERNIRPMTIERSNSKSFGSHEGVESSAVYHTIIATCKAQAISVCEYLKKFFTACIEGRTDYENLTPMMLCQLVK